MMTRTFASCVCVSLLLSLAVGAIAGPNEGGTLILHANPTLTFTSDITNYCGMAGLDSCSHAVTSIGWEPGKKIVFHALAAFPPGSSPRLKGLSFGISYDPAKFIIAARGSCADFELPDGAWPASGTGTAQSWTTATQTGLLTECYWFAGYAYSEQIPDSTSVALIPHPLQHGVFVDDGFPAAVDSIAAYGRLGFGTSGALPCPEDSGDFTWVPDGNLPSGGDAPEIVGGDSPRAFTTSAVLVLAREEQGNEAYGWVSLARHCGFAADEASLEDLRSWWPFDDDTTAIKNEIRLRFNHVDPLESYVLILGSWNQAPEEPGPFMPSCQRIDEDLGLILGWCPTDQPYGDTNEDNLPEIPVWRITPATAPQNSALLAKTHAYWDLHAASIQPWMRSVAVLSNDLPNYGRSPELARELSETVRLAGVADGFQVAPLCLASEVPQDLRQAVFPDLLNEGRAVIVAGPSVNSHVSTFLCFSESRYEFNDLTSTWKPPLVIGLSCLLGNFTDDDPWSIAKNWQHLSDPGVGPVAWIGPSAMSYQFVNAEIGEQLLYLLTHFHISFGQAMIHALRSAIFFHPEMLEAASLYQGFGAPWLVLPNSPNGNPTTDVAAQDLPSPAAQRIWPNPVRAGQEVQLRVSPSDYRRDLRVSIYDVAGRVVWTQVTHPELAPITEQSPVVRIRCPNLPAGVYFVRSHVRRPDAPLRMVVID